jgi:hypothetical protein
MAMANSAGRIPRSTSTAHQATARVRSACGKIPKNLPCAAAFVIGAALLQPDTIHGWAFMRAGA